MFSLVPSKVRICPSIPSVSTCYRRYCYLHLVGGTWKSNFGHAADKFGDKTAIKYYGKQLTWLDLELQSNSLANALLVQYKVKKGESVVILSSNHYAHFILVAACSKIGAVYSPINHLMGVTVISTLLSIVESKVIFINPKLSNVIKPLLINDPNKTWIQLEEDNIPFMEKIPKFSEIITANSSKSPPHVNIDTNDTAWRLTTSGTTGTPKAVEVSYNNISNTVVSFPIDKTVLLHYLHLFHVTYVIWLWGISKGSIITIMNSGFNVNEFINLCKRDKINISFVLPGHLKLLLEYARHSVENHENLKNSLASLQIMMYGAHAMEVHTIKNLIEVLPQTQFHQLYGLTEVGGPIAHLNFEDHLLALKNKPHLLQSVGRAINNRIVYRVVDDKNVPLPVGQTGNVQVAGPCVCKYYKRESTEEESMAGEFLMTGDIGKMDEEGYVYILGRSKEQIKTGKCTILPNLINEVLIKFPGLVDSICIGIPKNFYDKSANALHSQLEAFVVLKTGNKSTPEDIISFMKQNVLSEDFVPVHVHIIDQIPRNPLGKPDSIRLKAMRKEMIDQKT